MRSVASVPTCIVAAMDGSMKGRRLKVFQAHLGFYDTIVAAPSQKAALEARGASSRKFRRELCTGTA
jgi:hypothetical protein